MGGKRIPFPSPPPPPYTQDPPPDPVPSVVESTTKSDSTPPQPPPKPISASPIPPPRITIDRRGLPIRRLPSGCSRSTPSIIRPSNVNSNRTPEKGITDDFPPTKKVRFDTGNSSSHHGDSLETTDKTKYLSDIFQTQVDLSQVFASAIGEESGQSRGLYLKRKASDDEADDEADSEGSDEMDMEIDD